jgi:hypothetical protein
MIIDMSGAALIIFKFYLYGFAALRICRPHLHKFDSITGTRTCGTNRSRTSIPVQLRAFRRDYGTLRHHAGRAKRERFLALGAERDQVRTTLLLRRSGTLHATASVLLDDGAH